jgi:hypothetical protein
MRVNCPHRHNSYGFVRGIVDHGQILDHAAFSRAVEHKIH